MRQSWFTRGARLVLAVTALVVAAGTPAAAKPKPGVKRAGSNLFALVFQNMNVNNQFCPVINVGEVCTAPNGSGVGEGGFWPKGTPDSYIFNSGLQLGAVIPPGAGFAWAGDTIGAFFMDPRGDQQDGSPITLVYSSLDAGDQAAWPSDGIVTDTAVYNSVLLGRNSVSQEDLWFRSWDGSPSHLGGRTHPMGVAVDVRGMAWNYPSGNEDIMYFVYTFTNVTSSDPNDYNNATSTNPDPAYRANLAALGAQFQQDNDAAFGVTIPVHGYTFEHLFAAFFEDCDVGTDNVSNNYSTPLFPFAMGVCYEAPFFEPSWTATPGAYPTNIFTGPTFAQAPGFTAVKYLKSPVDTLTGKEFGITIFSNTVNGSTGYPDPVGVKQLYRYLSGTSSPGKGDLPCTNQGNQLALHYCVLWQAKVDTRFFESSGPFQLKPGQSSTIVVAYLNGPPVNNATLAAAQSSTDLQPGFALPAESLAAHPNSVRPIETIMGEIGYNDDNADGRIEQNEVRSVPRSLLDKALKAQAVFDAKFLLPFAPAAPTFFLIPGDNQVTVVWQKSPTEDPVTGGDPYFAIASDPTNALYDPNFRKFDVEGYRIYRGRTSGALQLIAQFDYAGTQMLDYTGQFEYGNCAPELGVQTGCPVTFDTVGVRTVSNPVPLVGNVIQVPPGGRAVLASGNVLVTTADTAVSGGGSGFPGLTDTGVNFAYIDRSVRNLFQYYYSVTAFDVNSIVSGPTSLESPKTSKTATPRAQSANVSSTVTVQGVYGSDGTLLNPGASYPAINPANGTFAGNVPPANDGAFVLSGAVEALSPGSISLTIDSIGNGTVAGISAPPNIYFTMKAGATTIHQVVPSPVAAFNASDNGTYNFAAALVSYDSAAARRFGLHFTQDARMPVAFSASAIAAVNTSPGHGTLGRRYGLTTAISAYLAHSRWFDEGGSEPADPTITGYPDSTHNAGGLKGVAKIWAPSAYRAGPLGGGPFPVNAFMRGSVYGMATDWYPGDFTLTWNADSSVSIVDVTNHIQLPVVPQGGVGYGFVNVRAFQAAGIANGDIDDGTGTGTAITLVGYHHVFGLQATCSQYWGINCANLEAKAQVEPLDFNSDGVADGQGVALVVNGEYFMFQLSGGQLPAAGTKWHLRAITGNETATCVGTAPAYTSCSGYTFAGGPRPSYAPGLTYKITVQKSFAVDSTVSGDLSLVHTVPDPYYVTNALEITPTAKVMKFVNLPTRAIIRIYSVSGVLVQVLTHNDQTGGGEQAWDLRSRSNQFVASGVYFYHVEGPDGKTKVGRFTVVQFAP
ncbi:MAG TPA: hypothetical protein VH113_02570 [Gemmatimonadales bacterium]|nr:hypothetical protein [Gemmatimonadales bacterium]